MKNILITYQIPMQFYLQETIFSVMQLLFSLNMNNYSPVTSKSIAFKKFSKRHQQRVIKKNVADTINLIYLENQEFRKCQLLKCFEYNLAKCRWKRRNGPNKKNFSNGCCT